MASSGYRPGHIRLSDGTFNKTVFGHPIIGDIEYLGIKECAVILDVPWIVLNNVVKSSEVKKVMGAHGDWAYDFDDVKAAWNKNIPPQNSARQSEITKRYTRYWRPLHEAIANGTLKPVHTIGDIKYYDIDEVKIAIESMRPRRDK